MVENAPALRRQFQPRPGRRLRRWTILLILLVAVAVVRTLLLTAFMADPLRTKGSPRFFDSFYLGHNCLTAYVHAAELAAPTTENLYLAGSLRRSVLRSFPDGRVLLSAAFPAADRRRCSKLGPDFLDRALPLLPGRRGRPRYRPVAGRPPGLGGELGRRAGLAALLVWASTPFLLTPADRQFPDCSPSPSRCWACSPSARGGRRSAGAARASPRSARFFRASWWSTCFSAAASATPPGSPPGASSGSPPALLAFGEGPLEQFVGYALPRIASGEAFAWLRIEELWWVRAINHSVPGLGLKLGTLFGALPSPATEKAISLLYSFLLLGLAFVASRRAAAASFLGETQLAIALLALGSMRSPFVPDAYGLIGPLLAVERGDRRRFAGAAGSRAGAAPAPLAAASSAASFVLPVDGVPLPGSGRGPGLARAPDPGARPLAANPVEAGRAAGVQPALEGAAG